MHTEVWQVLTKGISVTFVAGALAVRRLLLDKLEPSNILKIGLQLPNRLAFRLYCTVCGLFRPKDLELVHTGDNFADAAVETAGVSMICKLCPVLRDAGDALALACHVAAWCMHPSHTRTN